MTEGRQREQPGPSIPATVRRRVAMAAGWGVVSAGVTQASALLVAFGTARVLGVVGFGEFAIVNSTVGLLGVFAGLGLGMTATKYVAEFRESDPARVGQILRLLDIVVASTGLLTGLGLAVAAPLLAEHVLAAPSLTDALRLAAILLFLNEINGVQVGALAGFEAFAAIAKINVVRAGVALPMTILGAIWGGVMGAVGGMAIGTMLCLGVSTSFVRSERRRWGVGASSNPFSVAPILWRFAVPAFIASVVVGPVGWAGSALLVNQPSGYAQLGVFNAANQLRVAGLFLPTVVAQSSMPIIASLLATRRHASARRVVIGTIGASLLCALPISFGLAILSSGVMSMYGPAFASGSSVLVVVAITVTVIAGQLPIGQLIAAAGRMWLGAALNVAWACVFLVTAAVLVGSGHGALGLAAAYLIAYTVHTVWTAAAGWSLVSRISDRQASYAGDSEGEFGTGPG